MTERCQFLISFLKNVYSQAGYGDKERRLDGGVKVNCSPEQFLKLKTLIVSSPVKI